MKLVQLPTIAPDIFWEDSAIEVRLANNAADLTIYELDRMREEVSEISVSEGTPFESGASWGNGCDLCPVEAAVDVTGILHPSAETNAV